MTQSTVAVLDNDPFALEKIVSLVPKLCPELKACWSTMSAQEAVRRCIDDFWRPDVLLLDVELDDANAMEVCQRIRSQVRAMPMLAITSYSPKKYASALALAGAQGVVVKGDLRQMKDGLVAVLGGGTYCSVPDVEFSTPAEYYENCRALSSEDIDTAKELTLLQTEIIKAVAKGRSTEEIAHDQYIDTATVRSHTRNIRRKLHARSLCHAVAIWLAGNKG